MGVLPQRASQTSYKGSLGHPADLTPESTDAVASSRSRTDPAPKCGLNFNLMKSFTCQEDMRRFITHIILQKVCAPKDMYKKVHSSFRHYSHTL